MNRHKAYKLSVLWDILIVFFSGIAIGVGITLFLWGF